MHVCQLNRDGGPLFENLFLFLPQATTPGHSLEMFVSRNGVGCASRPTAVRLLSADAHDETAAFSANRAVC